MKKFREKVKNGWNFGWNTNFPVLLMYLLKIDSITKSEKNNVSVLRKWCYRHTDGQTDRWIWIHMTCWQTQGSKKEAKCRNLPLEINLYEKITGYKFWLIIITYNQCTFYERKEFMKVCIFLFVFCFSFLFQPFFAITSSSRYYCTLVFPFTIRNTVLQSNHIAINFLSYIFFLCIFIFCK